MGVSPVRMAPRCDVVRSLNHWQYRTLAETDRARSLGHTTHAISDNLTRTGQGMARRTQTVLKSRQNHLTHLELFNGPRTRRRHTAVEVVSKVTTDSMKGCQKSHHVGMYTAMSRALV